MLSGSYISEWYSTCPICIVSWFFISFVSFHDLLRTLNFLLTPKSQMEVGCPGNQGLQPQSYPEAEELRVTSTTCNLAASPRRKPPISTCHTEAWRPMEISKSKKKDNNITNNNTDGDDDDHHHNNNNYNNNDNNNNNNNNNNNDK